jgi:TP53 regulating kinase-like protein
VNPEQKVILEKLASQIGAILGKLHANNVIHGDLTTSNILVDEQPSGEQSLCLIDFGLGHAEGSAEDKGVDLYVLERALLSAHPNTEFMFEAILTSYQNQMRPDEKMCSEVIRKFEEIRLRGRKRTMVG